jgi:hypothetical protein
MVLYPKFTQMFAGTTRLIREWQTYGARVLAARSDQWLTGVSPRRTELLQTCLIEIDVARYAPGVNRFALRQLAK